MVDEAMSSSSPLLVCMSRTKSSMVASCSAVVAHHQVGTLGHDGQLVVGDQRGDLDDDMAVDVEPGHLEVHPHQHRGDASGVGRRGPR